MQNDLTAKILQIAITVVTAAALGVSELFDYNNVAQSRAFDDAERQRRYSNACLLVGATISIALVIVIAVLDPKELVDEKVWTFLLLCYLFLRRWNANRRINRICEQFVDFALTCPVCYHFGSPRPASVDELLYLENAKALRRFPFRNNQIPQHWRHLEWTIAAREETTERTAILIEHEKSLLGRMFKGKRGLIVSKTNKGREHIAGRSRRTFITNNYCHAIFFLDGVNFRDQVMREKEMLIERSRKDGLEPVAIAASWALLSLLFHPMHFLNDSEVMKHLCSTSKAVWRIQIRGDLFTPGWESLRTLAVRHAAESHGCGPRLANLTAAIAHSMINGNSTWAPVVFSFFRTFWDSNIRLVLDASLAMVHPKELATQRAVNFHDRLAYVGYGGFLHERLVNKLCMALRADMVSKPRLKRDEARIIERMIQTLQQGEAV